MCDTIFASPTSTAKQVMLFGKNSDRQRNEAQSVEHFRGREHPREATLTCTYLTIPQARQTHSVLLCRPFWAWGAEMGANEHGLVIGNEAVHARSPPSEQQGLPGMDLVRLGLERATTAAEALHVMTDLLQRYGAGGNCGHPVPAYFDNSFIIADYTEAFVLEAVDREWWVERIQGVRSISNVYSIGAQVESVSAGLKKLIRERGWSQDETPNYAAVIANPHREHIGNAKARNERSTFLLRSMEGRLAVSDMWRILRDHGADASAPAWDPRTTLTYTLCMHAGAGDRLGQTAGSLVSEVGRTASVHWVTGTAAPCTAIFKPVLLDVPLPPHGPPPTARFDSDVLWWRHERLHRMALRGEFTHFLQSLRAERDSLELSFRFRIQEVLQGGSASERAEVVAQCWREASATEERWFAQLPRDPVQDDSPYQSAWREMSRLAALDLP